MATTKHQYNDNNENNYVFKATWRKMFLCYLLSVKHYLLAVIWNYLWNYV